MSCTLGIVAGRGSDETSKELRERSLEALVGVQRKLTALVDRGAGTSNEHLADPQTAPVGDGALGRDLMSRLAGLCSAFGQQSGVACRLDIRSADLRFDGGVAEVLCRATRELLGLHKQAQATQIEVSSERRADGAVAVNIRNVDAESAQRCGTESALERDNIGLWSIDQRLREAGAYLEINRTPGVCASIVVPPRAAGLPIDDQTSAPQTV
jgi:hypothetical protein